MSSTFIALPLSSGEAFLLRTPDKTGRERVMLVDSGKKYGERTRELAKILSEISPRIDHIDFAICTHSDADHSQGFWSFTDDWYGLNRTLGEYWLPGGWANAMPAILTDPTGFASKLMDGAIQASRYLHSVKGEMKSISREERYFMAGFAGAADAPSDAVVELNDDDPPTFHAGFGLSEAEAASLRIDIEETDDAVDPFDAASNSMLRGSELSLLYFERFISGLSLNDALSISLESNVSFQEVAETAKAIRKIALSALEHNIRVRWFDFGKFRQSGLPRGGQAGLLEPCCAVEVAPDPSRTKLLSNLMLFHNLRLTRQNVESLVFYRPEDDDEPGVLFLGDSRLAHGIEKPGESFPRPFDKPKRKLLVTAPHHGSRNNDHAYGVLSDWLGTDQQYYIRNGGQVGQTLHKFLMCESRRCAQCVQCNGKQWHQWVAVSSFGSDWKWPPNAEECGSPSS